MKVRNGAARRSTAILGAVVAASALALVSPKLQPAAASPITVPGGGGQAHAGAAEPGIPTPQARAQVTTTNYVRGIDIASYQHPSNAAIDWSAVAHSGIGFAIIKATEGTSYVNPYYAADAAAAKAQGITVGAYAFGRPDSNDPVAQADRLVNVANYVNDGKTLPPMLDLEGPYPGLTVTDRCWNKSPAALVSWIRQFTNEIHTRTGRQPLLYMNMFWWNQCTGNNTSFGDRPLDIANWSTTSQPALPAGWSHWTVWQYSDAGTVAGIKGNVDLDYFNGTVNDMRTFARETDRLAPAAGGSAISPTSSSVAFFHRTATATLLMRMYVNGSGWQPPVALGAPPGGLTWDPDVATWGDGHMDAITRDAAGHLVIRVFVPDSGWTDWRIYRYVMNSSPAAASPTPQSLYVFYRGNGNTLQAVHWASATGWTGPAAVPGVANVRSGPDAATMQGTGNTTVVYRTTDGRMWTVTLTPQGKWGAPTRVNPRAPLPAAPAMVDPSIGDSGNGTFSVYYTGVNGVVYHCNYNPATNSWSPWWSIPGARNIRTAPDVANHGATHVDVTAGIYTTAWNADRGWRSWQPLT